MDKPKQFLIKIQSKNKLRQTLNEKKQIYAKMVPHPEMLSETLVLKAEIDAIELELENLR